MKINIKSLVILTCLFTTIATSEEFGFPHILVNGTATTRVTPDLMNWTLKVENKGIELQKVATTHTEIVAQVLTIIKNHNISSKDTKTTSMTFGEDWAYRNGSRVKDGYKASTNISFKLEDFKKYKPLWLKLATIKDLSVTGVNYDYSKRIEVQNKTREAALLEARQKALNLTKVIGSTIAEPLMIKEGHTPTHQQNRMLSFSEVSQASGDAVSPGQIEIKMTITVAFRLITLQ